jgi:DeoR/GlpR family transcriptional regulator of sugar metabolism
MNAKERHDQMIRAVSERRTLSMRRAQELTAASEITIRRDFAILAETGVVERHRGGIGLPSGGQMSPFAFRQVRFSEEKAALARRAVGLLKPDDALFVDGGTTTYHLATCLPDIPLQIFTNSLRFADAMGTRKALKSTQNVHLSGGKVYMRGGLLVGPGAVHGLEQYHAKWAFLSVAGITEQGFYNTDEEIAAAERAMICNADKVVVLADHSKIGNYALCSICPLDHVDYLITDADPEGSTLLAKLVRKGITVLHVPAAQMMLHNGGQGG